MSHRPATSVRLFSSARSICAKYSPSAPFLRRLLGHGNNVDRYAIEAHALEQILGVAVDVQLAGFSVLSEVQCGYFRHVLIFAFTLFFLQFEGDASDGAALDTFHEMGRVAGDLEIFSVSICGRIVRSGRERLEGERGRGG
jgi:hypothetical protein